MLSMNIQSIFNVSSSSIKKLGRMADPAYWSIHLFLGFPRSRLPFCLQWNAALSIFHVAYAAYDVFNLSGLSSRQNIFSSWRIVSFLILSRTVQPFTDLKNFISAVCILVKSWVHRVYVSESYRRLGTAMTLRNFSYISGLVFHFRVQISVPQVYWNLCNFFWTSKS